MCVLTYLLPCLTAYINSPPYQNMIQLIISSKWFFYAFAEGLNSIVGAQYNTQQDFLYNVCERLHVRAGSSYFY